MKQDIKSQNIKLNQGFTLLEVLISLAILSLAMIPLIKTPVAMSINQNYLKSKTFAAFVALNKISELHLERKFPAIGTESGSELMAGQEWFWETKIVVANSLFKQIRRIEVTVSDGEEKDSLELIKMVSLVGNPK